jgi:hypothetical protein
MQATGLARLKPADAVHLASAQRAKVSELHTFDDKILDLDNKIIGGDGNLLKICRPSQSAPIGPLFEGSDNSTSGTER